MSSVSNLQDSRGVEELTPAAQAVDARCIAEAGAYFASILASRAAQSEVAA